MAALEKCWTLLVFLRPQMLPADEIFSKNHRLVSDRSFFYEDSVLFSYTSLKKSLFAYCVGNDGNQKIGLLDFSVFERKSKVHNIPLFEIVCL